MAPHRASPSTSRVLRASVSSASGFFTAECACVLACDPFTSSCSSCPRSLSRYEPELTSLRDGPYGVRDKPRGEYCGDGAHAPSAKAPRESSRALRKIDRGIHTERRHATLELVVLRLARGVRALGAFFGKRRFRTLPRRTRRCDARRAAVQRAPRARVAAQRAWVLWYEYLQASRVTTAS